MPNKCTALTITKILKPYEYIKDDVITYFSTLLRNQFEAQVTDTLFCNSLDKGDWWHGRKFFDFANCKSSTTKPSVFAQKLMMPIFRNNHWTLCLRYASTIQEVDYDWKFYFLDSLNSESNYRVTMNSITTRTSLHWKRELVPKISEHHKDPDSYTKTMVVVPQQSELDCGSRLMFHMMLAALTNSPQELQQHITQLEKVPDLSQRCRQWAHDIVSHQCHLGQLPSWFPSSMLAASPLNGGICLECKGKFQTNIGIYVGAKVSIENLYDDINHGISNGTVGTIASVIYERVSGPHAPLSKRMPKYVLVEMADSKSMS